MTHKRNVAGLRASARLRHQDALRRTHEALQLLITRGERVNFKTVAAAARVSTAWLYQQAEIRQRIVHLRDQRAPPASVPPKERASETSKEAMLRVLRQRVKALEEENRTLRRQVEVAYGQLYAAKRWPADTSPTDTELMNKVPE